MPASHPTSAPATAKSPLSAAAQRARTQAKTAPTKAKSVPPSRTKATVKAPAVKAPAAKAPAAKAPAKAAAGAKSSGNKSGKDVTKKTQAPSKAGKVAAKKAIPATKAGIGESQKAQTAAAKADPKNAKEATPAKKESLGHAQNASHAKTQPKEQDHLAAAPPTAPKSDKPEPKRDRGHEEAAKKPIVRRSSLVDFPVPPPPVRPPFVPPKPVTVPIEEHAPVGVNASHSPALIQKQRQRLLDLRDDLVDALSGMTRDTIRNAPEGSEASGSGMHQGDAGSDAYDRDFALSVLAKEQDALYEIDQALRRIQKGIYGVCEMSNRKIPQARLEAIPFARLTVECQSQWEKEYGNRRFRPSNEVGFSGGNLAEDEDSETVLLDEEED